MIKWVLRIWWILAAAASIRHFCLACGPDAGNHALQGGLFLLTATVAFVGTALVGRLDILLALHGHTVSIKDA